MISEFHGPRVGRGTTQPARAIVQTGQSHSARILAAWEWGEENLGDDDPTTCLSPRVGFPYIESLGTGDPLGGSTCEDSIWRQMTKR